MANGLLMPVVSREWALSDTEQSIFFSSVIFVHFLASLFTGKIANKYGRQLPLSITSFAISLCHFLSSFAPSYSYFFFIRLFMGVFYAINDNTLSAIVSEVATIDTRAAGNAYVYISWGAGQLLMVLMSYFLWQDSTIGDWRLLTQLTGFLLLAISVYIYFNLMESPRYLLVD
jgi:MFS family permease